MFNWFKNLWANNNNTSSTPAEAIKIPNEELAADKASIVLTDNIEAYLNSNGPEQTMSWLLEALVKDMSGAQSADIFSGYYNNHYSKRDILDKYDDIIVIDENILKAITKLGEYYDPKYIDEKYDNIAFYVISKSIITDIAELVARNSISLKAIDNKLYSEYFNFVKTSLSLAQKVKASLDEPAPIEEPVDEIEATIRMLLEAENKANR